MKKKIFEKEKVVMKIKLNVLYILIKIDIKIALIPCGHTKCCESCLANMREKKM